MRTINKIILLFVLMLCGIVFVQAALWQNDEKWVSVRHEEQPALVSVKPGSSIRLVMSNLISEGLFRPNFSYRLWLRMAHLPAIEPGEYEYLNGESLADLWDKFSEGEVKLYPVRIIEGRTIHQFLPELKQLAYIKQDIKASDAQGLAKELALPYPSAEGLIAPTTLNVPRNTSLSSILQRCYTIQARWLKEAWANRSTKTPIKTPYEALVLASIIEKETAIAGERREISGVFNRRLEKGMRLQTDPTVIYGIGPSFNGDITRADLRRPTKWNTYVIKGLPPTPISTVGRLSIQAALHPLPGNTLYFVASGDGGHVFSTTLSQHNKAVKQYLSRSRNDK